MLHVCVLLQRRQRLGLGSPASEWSHDASPPRARTSPRRIARCEEHENAEAAQAQLLWLATHTAC
jgi:hypothetical protein